VPDIFKTNFWGQQLKHDLETVGVRTNFKRKGKDLGVKRGEEKINHGNDT
jgi:hypothetical protein